MNTLTDKELNDLLSLMIMVGQEPSIKAYDPYYGKVSQEVWEHSHSVETKTIETGLIPVLFSNNILLL